MSSFDGCVSIKPVKSHFSCQFFKNNRSKLLAKLPKNACVVVAGNGIMQRSGDTQYPFRQDSNFWYLTGLDVPDLVLVLSNDSEFVIRQERGVIRATFDGDYEDEELKSTSGIEKIFFEAEGWKNLHGHFRTNIELYFNLPLSTYDNRHGHFVNPWRRRIYTKLMRFAPKNEIYDIRTVLAVMRSIKQEPEINAIRSAIAITGSALSVIKSKMDSYGYENQIEGDLTAIFRSAGASGHAYTPIVASGKNATTLHYTQNNAMLKKGEYIVMDVGAEVEGYAADITRTYATGRPTKRQQDVMSAVQVVQAHACELFRPGLHLRDLEHQTRDMMADQLVKLGLITSKYDSDAVAKYYPHATSHFLGLDVHDVGDYQSALQAGNVLTCEPGIYIPDEGIGVRIEDDLLITNSGYQNLSAKCDR